MSIKAFSSAFSSPGLESRILVADTSFILNVVDSNEKFSAEARMFVESNPKTTFCFNVTVRNELLHNLRWRLIQAHVANLSIAPWVKSMCREQRSRIDKAILRGRKKGALELKAALNGKLSVELALFEKGFVYYAGKPKAGSIEWTDAVKIMEQYGLDSSDSMILNFALKMGFSGIATCDSDYNTIDSKADFDVFMPGQLIW